MSDPYWTPPGSSGSNIISSADVIASGGDPGIVAGSTSGGGGVNLFADSLADTLHGSPTDQIMQAADFNNRWSAQQAAITRSWQESQNEKAMQFSAEQAALNRTWQEEMSNTAHQREVRDLQAAGLNPVLSASGGNGASVGSGAQASGVTSAGATGQTDNSSTGALTSYLAQMLAAQTSILNTQVSAQASLAGSELMSAASQAAAGIAAAAAMHGHDTQLEIAGMRPENILGGLIGESLTATGVNGNTIDGFLGGLQNKMNNAGRSVRTWFETHKPVDVQNAIVGWLNGEGWHVGSSGANTGKRKTGVNSSKKKR